MSWNGRWRPSVASVDPRRFTPRGARLLVESLESRPLLSTASPIEIMSPAVAAVAPDWGSSSLSSSATNPNPVTSAITPAQLSKAYGLTQSSDGTGITIAIIDAYDDPNIQADLLAFDAKYSLPNSTLTVVNQSGQTTNLPSTNASWSLEIALDVEWAHAAAPGAKIVLVEANSASITDLMMAVQTAASMANVVSLSWGGSEFQGETDYDTKAYFANPNVTFVAASGDDGGAYGASWPATSPYVLGVGGTSLTLSSSGGYGSETAWSASGTRWSGYSGSTGGVSTIESMPSYQATALGSSYVKRATPDVSLDANPGTGLSVYDSVSGLGQTGWFQVGGTSAGAPIWAGLVASADQARVANHLTPLSSSQTLNLLYGLYGTTSKPSSTYATSFHDVTSGSNFVATAGKGYDLVTGLGTPVASSLISAASTYGVTTSVTKAAVVATSTTTTSATHATSPTQTVLSTPTTTTVANSSVVFILPIGPVTTTTTTLQAFAASKSVSASASALTTSATVAVSPALPAQSLPQPAPVLRLSSSDEGMLLPPTPETPSRPGLFLDPVEMREIGEVAPALATRPIPPESFWDAALERFFAEDGGIPTPGLSTLQPPAIEPETDEPASASPAALAGLAVAIWGTWEYRSRRSDRDLRRRSPARALSAI